jgi:hypothetical protein
MLGPLAFLALRGKTSWAVLQAFYKAGWRFNEQVTPAKLGSAAGLLVGAIFAVYLGYWLLRRSRQKTPSQISAAVDQMPATKSPEPVREKAVRRSGPQRVHSCNVLQVGADQCRVWQFDARGGSFTAGREEAVGGGESLPYSVVTKTWRSLWQPKLNVAWLPPQSVFLRVAHLPKSSFAETVSMVELQLEKLSPIPVTQAVWSVHALTQAAGDLQTVIVLLAERKAVEEFLGQLEGQGYLADRLEVPLLDQLEATAVTGDGAWIFPEAIGGRNNALMAWWYGGALQNLNLISLPAAGDCAAGVKAQLAQIAWAGELEGWLTAPPAWHLVADEALAAEWESALRQGLEEPVHVSAPVKPAELAALTAKRASAADASSNLLPAEFTTRYQQRFVDRLWMRGLAAVVGLYLVGVLIYALALGVLFLRTQSAENKVAAISNTYTNAIQLKARYQVLKDRQDLKYAALDCWKAVGDVLPNEITLDGFNFNDGHKLTLNGSAPGGQDKAVVDFNEAMRNATVNSQPLFDKAKGDPLSYRAGPGGTVSWNFSLELKRTEAQ